MIQFKMMIGAGLCLAALASAPAMASTDLGFESGDLSGWTSNGPASAVTYYSGALLPGDPGYSPVSGDYLAAVEAGLGQGVYSTISQTFNLLAGDTISGWTGFKANDNYFDPLVAGVFNDDGYLAVNNVHLFDWSVASVGDFASTGWIHFSFTAADAGAYTLTLAVANQGDNAFSSAAVLDAVSVTGDAGPVPEAATWAMMVVGFGLAGATLRTRRNVVRFG